MKTLKVMLSVFVCMLAFTVSTVGVAATSLKNDVGITISSEPTKTQIDPAQLPQAVKDAIEDGEYANWEIDKAYKITYKTTPDKVEYEVKFKNAKKETETEQYTKDGEVIDD